MRKRQRNQLGRSLLLTVISSVTPVPALAMASSATAGPASEAQGDRTVMASPLETALARSLARNASGVDAWLQQAKLTASDGVGGEELGISLAFDGDTAFIGANSAEINGNSSQGAVYVFVREGGEWIEQAKLTASDGSENDFFGTSVALEGNTAVIGADLWPAGIFDNRGAAYVFTRNGDTWTEEARLVASDGEEDDDFGAQFGASVAISGDTILVGARYADSDQGFDHGAAYVFVRNGGTWSEQAKLMPSDAIEDMFFGADSAVAFVVNTALIGASGANPNGAAYVFTRSGDVWTEDLKITASDGPETGVVGFGAAVAMTAETALVGASLEDEEGGDAGGVVYVLHHDGGSWTEEAELTPSDGAAAEGFGSPVALAGDTAVVGAQFMDVDAGDEGAAYVFQRSGGAWTEQARLTAGDGAPATYFGVAVAVAEPIALVGAHLADVDGNTHQGAAYAFVPSEFLPVALAADSEPLGSLSDGNHVFEPGERVEIAPSWQNVGPFLQFVAGNASNFTGPAGPSYEVVVEEADYGGVDAGMTASCRDTELCYQLDVGPVGVPRPVLHWDATFDEALSVQADETWTLHVGDSFPDVPRAHPLYRFIETLLHRHATSGCGDGAFCPADPATRAHVALFLLRGLEGDAFTPPPCVPGEERFLDVPADHEFCPWIEELARREITTGCGGGNYCPDGAVTRAAAAPLLLRTLEGAEYVPPECVGLFADVPCPSPFAAWIEDLATRGIAAGCGGDNYCPATAITRSQMAVFVTRTFGLVLYGP